MCDKCWILLTVAIFIFRNNSEQIVIVIVFRFLSLYVGWSNMENNVALLFLKIANKFFFSAKGLSACSIATVNNLGGLLYHLAL